MDDYSALLLSGVELAEKADGLKPGSLYPASSPFRPDLFTDQVLEGIVEHFGSVSRCCELNGFSFPRLIRGLTSHGEQDLSLPMAKAVSEALGLDLNSFANRIYEPLSGR